jgi:hypothetical protein
MFLNKYEGNSESKGIFFYKGHTKSRFTVIFQSNLDGAYKHEVYDEMWMELSWNCVQ